MYSTCMFQVYQLNCNDQQFITAYMYISYNSVVVVLLLLLLLHFFKVTEYTQLLHIGVTVSVKNNFPRILTISVQSGAVRCQSHSYKRGHTNLECYFTSKSRADGGLYFVTKKSFLSAVKSRHPPT